MFDPERYRDKAEVAHWVERDPIESLRARLALSDDEWTAMQRDVDAEMQRAVAFAEAGTEEPVEELTRFVHSERGAR
jgi:pyruvate dehydrogenase E1 component alpha subunit